MRLSDVRLRRETCALGDIKVDKDLNFTLFDQAIKPDDRFFTSLYSRYGISGRFFDYFDHHEVFSRIKERSDKGDVIQVTIDETTDTPTLLSLCNSRWELPDVADIENALKDGGINIDSFKADFHTDGRTNKQVQRSARVSTTQNAGSDRIAMEGAFGHASQVSADMMLNDIHDITYSRGVVRVLAMPRANNDFDINGDKFLGRYVLDIPVDGYGSPAVYLAMLRQVCTNLSVGLTKTFKSSLNLNKSRDYVEAVGRAMESFNDDEGYDIIRDRFTKAGQSWASINEAQQVYQALITMHNKGFIELPDGTEVTTEVTSTNDGNVAVGEYNPITSPVLRRYRELLGDMTKAYGIANLDALSTRRKQVLPTACSVYDLLNFMTEVGTHWTNIEGQRRMQGLVGTFLANKEYDLEGSKSRYSDFQEMFLADPKTKSIAATIK